MTMTQADQILHSATRLEISRNGTPISSGTGFIYSIDLPNGSPFPLLITNKHVLEGGDRVTLVFNVASATTPAQPTAEIMAAQMSYSLSEVVQHPDADLCALPIIHILADMHQRGKPLFFVSTTNEIIPTEEQWENFDSIEEVVMVGCPNGLFDRVNNTPIVRRGITATPLSKRFQGQDEFMIDMACFPGSSGSPVFVYNQLGSFDRKSNVINMGSSRLHLVGILHAGPLFNNRGQIVLSKTPSFQVATMMHLGQVIRSTALFKIEELARAKLGLTKSQ
jgi:hypothetical protein